MDDLLKQASECFWRAATDCGFSELIDSVTLQKTVVFTKERQHGEFASNIAFLLQNKSPLSLMQIATQFSDTLSQYPEIARSAVAKGGFVNIDLEASFWSKLIRNVSNGDVEHQISDPKKLNIEFVSANLTGSLHVGHLRGAIIGDTLASILQALGHNVTREYYINDAGKQVEKFCQAVLQYAAQQAKCPGVFGQLEEYQTQEAEVLGDAVYQRWQATLCEQPLADARVAIRPFVLDTTLATTKKQLQALQVHHDVFSSEQAIIDHGTVEKAVEVLRAKGLIYQGVLDEPKGQKSPDWSPRPQLLFKATELGDTCDRPLTKSDGSWTYFATDIGYHYDKINRGYQTLVIVLGKDHIGYTKRLISAIQKLADHPPKIFTVLCDIVNIVEEGQVVKLSKRSGKVISAETLIQNVGNDGIRSVMLSRNSDSVLDFDLQKARELVNDNPIFYLQYAHARAYSLLRKAQDTFPNLEALLEHANPAQANEPSELALKHKIAQWPRQLELIAETMEPHWIHYHLHHLAKAFHVFWNTGKKNVHSRCIIQNEPELSAARLLLIKACAMILASGLKLLKINPLKEL